MNEIVSFMTQIYIVLAVALVALAGFVGTWTVQFFARNHKARIARHQPVAAYYRGLALSH